MDLGTNTASVNSIGTDGQHTVFVIDILAKPGFDPNIFTQCLDAILAFGNSLLMQSGANKLSIFGSSTVKNTVLYLDQFVDPEQLVLSDTGAQMEKFAQITSVTRANFLQWIRECVQLAAEDSTVAKVSMISGAISQALCLINRHKEDFKQSRVVIFSLGTGSTDNYSSQYMKLINCFFAGQKGNVIFDACSVMLTRDSEDTAPVSASMEDRFAASILQQGCDLTGGRYIRVHKVSTLLEHLFWCFIPSAEERSKLVLPPKLKISPPAACFCHRKVLEVGYVCSVCVSIFCQYLPFCTTCHSNVFVNNLKKIAQLKAAAVENGHDNSQIY